MAALTGNGPDMDSNATLPIDRSVRLSLGYSPVRVTIRHSFTNQAIHALYGHRFRLGSHLGSIVIGISTVLKLMIAVPTEASNAPAAARSSVVA